MKSLNLKLAISYILVSILSYGLNPLVERYHITFWVGLLVPFLSILIGSVFGIAFSLFFITKRVMQMTEATKKMSEGDLRINLSDRSKDEIGQLANCFKAMTNSLAMVLKEVKTISDNIYNAALNLSSTSQEMNASTEEIAASVQEITKGADIQAEMVNKSFEIIKKMALSIGEISQKAEASQMIATMTQEKLLQDRIPFPSLQRRLMKQIKLLFAILSM